ncbi:MAG: NTP transferase domain-containing protein [Candidatus Eremiobacterota bacterium]
MKPVKAVILAGGKLDNSFKNCGENTFNKAFIEINNRFMLEYVIEALKKASLVEEIILMIPENIVTEQVKKNIPVNVIGNSGESLVKTVVNSLKYIPADTQRLLLVMADLPLLTDGAVDDFVRRCYETDGEYYYSILRKEDMVEKFPDARNTYIKLKDGTFCGGGLVMLKPEICDKYRTELMDKMTQERKNPLEMARMLGATTLLKIATGQATRKDLEKRTSELFKCKTISIVTPYAEIGINVDRPGELELVRSLYKQN